MRLFLAVLGTVSILTGAVAFYLGLQNTGEDNNQSAIRQALKSQVKAVAADVDQGFETQKKILEGILSALEDKKTKKTNLLEQIGAPILLLTKSENEVHAYKAKKSAIAEDVRAVAEAFFGKDRKFGLVEGNDHSPYLLAQGSFKNFAYVALYRQESLFTTLRGSAAIRPWVAMDNGQIIFHALSRHTGVNSANVRPVAQGLESLRRGQQSEMLANYVGLDGQEILGAWITLPNWGMVVGSEWPALAVNRASVPLVTWLAIVAFVMGAFLLGSCLTPRPIQVTAVQREIKDLSHEARTFIKRAEKQAEGALEFARKREDQCAELEAKAREKLAYAERTRWVFERTESFFEEVVEIKEEHRVWNTLGEYLSQMAMRTPVLIFTYSASSCSLIPQSQVGIEEFPETAKRYLADSRMLVGDLQALMRLSSTSAYAQWRERWERYMPLAGMRIHELGFASPTGSRGVVFFLFPEGRMTDKEIEKQQELWSLFAYRAAWLYDMKKRLLQSKHATKRTEKLAGTADRTRDRSPTA